MVVLIGSADDFIVGVAQRIRLSFLRLVTMTQPELILSCFIGMADAVKIVPGI